MNEAFISIVDCTGKLISEKSYNDLQNIEIKLPNEAGVYFIKVSVDQVAKTFKLVKE